jgi:SAM-dependent methyltransferase
MIGTDRCYACLKQAGCGRSAYDRAVMSSDQPQTWHYGLVARYWAEKRQDAAEAEFLKPYVEAGQPALDVGCGTGRILTPLLNEGFDVDGVDISPDMLAYARERAEGEGFTPNLYAQPMHELDLPRTYRTIYSCGSLGIGGTREQDRQTLARIHHYLEPGGYLIFDHEMPYSDPEGWSYWTRDGRANLPEEFDEGGWTGTEQGDEYRLRSRVVDVDPLEQRMTMEMQGSVRRGDELVVEETRTIVVAGYTAAHIELLLETAGFGDLQLLDNWTDSQVSSDTTNVTFVARKPF